MKTKKKTPTKRLTKKKTAVRTTAPAQLPDLSDMGLEFMMEKIVRNEAVKKVTQTMTITARDAIIGAIHLRRCTPWISKDDACNAHDAANDIINKICDARRKNPGKYREGQTVEDGLLRDLYRDMLKAALEELDRPAK